MNSTKSNDCHCWGLISHDCTNRPSEDISNESAQTSSSSAHLQADNIPVSTLLFQAIQATESEGQRKSDLSTDELADSLSASLATIAAARAQNNTKDHAPRTSHRSENTRGLKRKYSNGDISPGSETYPELMMAYAPSSKSSHRGFKSSPKLDVGRAQRCQHELYSSKTSDNFPFFQGLCRSDLDSDEQGQAALLKPTTVIARPPNPGQVAEKSYCNDIDNRCIDQKEAGVDSLLPPFRDPCIHTIRKTFRKFVKRSTQKVSASGFHEIGGKESFSHQRKSAKVRQNSYTSDVISSSRSPPPVRRFLMADGVDDSGSFSGSGSEGGYAASSSSNGKEDKAGSGCSSPSSEESSEESFRASQSRKNEKLTLSGDSSRPMLRKKHEYTHSASSDIADFSSSNSAVDSDSMELLEAQSESTSITSSSSNSADNSDYEQQENCFSRPESRITMGEKYGGRDSLREMAWVASATSAERKVDDTLRKKRVCISESKPGLATIDGRPPILALGGDIMAHVLTFLQPTDILDVVTMPLSKDWVNTFTRQPELWRVLCLLEPFKANVDDRNDSGDESDFPFHVDSTRKSLFGRFRLLYTSFVRCMRYLIRIKEDAINGRPPSVIDFGGLGGTYHNISANRNLQQFFSRARTVMDGESNTLQPSRPLQAAAQASQDVPVTLFEEESLSYKRSQVGLHKSSLSQKSSVKFGHSKLTQRLLGPASNGQVREVELPWSCGIYSIVNWMVAFADVEGIQTMCLQVLPFLLENEQQRITAQRAGLTDIVLRAMVLFPDSTQLHTAAFHSIVLLARPLGGQEGMLFHTSMVNSSGIFDSAGGSNGGKNGIAVLLDSMRRFQTDKQLQSMSCWSLVNIALAPAQKEILVVLGGIEATAQAMLKHPLDAEVQFRALFALINLVIPSVNMNHSNRNEGTRVMHELEQPEREMLDDMVNQIVHLVVLSMKNFCSNEAILNRACLVLHNLSLTPEYHEAMLWTPNCYQMLEWCLANYQTDQVLQQSAAGTLHRLQTTLSRNDSLRARFAATLQAQQQLSLEQARAEAVMFNEHHDRPE